MPPYRQYSMWRISRKLNCVREVWCSNTSSHISIKLRTLPLYSESKERTIVMLSSAVIPADIASRIFLATYAVLPTKKKLFCSP